MVNRNWVSLGFVALAALLPLAGALQVGDALVPGERVVVALKPSGESVFALPEGATYTTGREGVFSVLTVEDAARATTYRYLLMVDVDPVWIERARLPGDEPAPVLTREGDNDEKCDSYTLNGETGDMCVDTHVTTQVWHQMALYHVPTGTNYQEKFCEQRPWWLGGGITCQNIGSPASGNWPSGTFVQSACVAHPSSRDVWTEAYYAPSYSRFTYNGKHWLGSATSC